MPRLAKHTRVVINHGMHANSKELISTICHTVLADAKSPLMAIVPWQHSIHDLCSIRRAYGGQSGLVLGGQVALYGPPHPRGQATQPRFLYFL